MIVVTTRAELREALGETSDIGFVPTMGYLHEGHMSLVRAAARDCRTVVASIFVNPRQFGPTEDLSTYPRDLDADLTKLADAGCSIVFVPGVDDVYPPGFASSVTVSGVTSVLEGSRRPTHFEGVTTVVAILFNLVAPRRAYFGQKDAQQCAVISKLVKDLGYRCQIVIVPTMREADGLAMSSRNTYLTEDQRAAAPVLYRALSQADAAWKAGELRNGDDVRDAVARIIASEPSVLVDYISCADARTLGELDEIAPDTPVLVSLAARVGKTRLIDNVTLPARSSR